MIKNQIKRHSSLHLILMLIVVFIVTFVMSIHGIFSYIQLKEKHHTTLTAEIDTSANQLQDSIRPYVESYAPDEYLNLIANEMKHGNILAIVVEDYPMGNILGQDAFISGKVRDTNGNLIDFNVENKGLQNLLGEAALQKEVAVLSKINDEKIALITIYGTDQYLNEELQELVLENVFVTLIIYVLLIGGIYYGINLFMIEPIQEMISNIKKTDPYGLPVEKLDEVGSKEVVTLSSSINGMMDTVKLSRSKLQEQKEEFETIFNSAQDGIAIVDLTTRFLQFNQAYLEMTGYTKQELLKLTCIELAVPEDRKRTKQRLEHVIANGQISNFEIQSILNNGKLITVNISMSLLPDKQRILITAKDVTKLKIIESQAKLASMGEMIGNIAHQWRQPLSIISTDASGAKIEKQLGVLTDEQFNKHMDSIVGQTKYLSNTIDDFRNFIKEGSKEPQSIEIIELIEKALILAEASFKNNYIELVKNFEADEKILGHENELVQALINIFNNAKDAIKENLQDSIIKVIFVETKKVDNGIVILIKDNAGGIPSEIKDRIFEPYFTTKHQNVGTGIGLSLARSIFTEHHHATIDFNNEEFEYKGEKFTGACFKITFINHTDN